MKNWQVDIAILRVGECLDSSFHTLIICRGCLQQLQLKLVNFFNAQNSNVWVSRYPLQANSYQSCRNPKRLDLIMENRQVCIATLLGVGKCLHCVQNCMCQKVLNHTSKLCWSVFYISFNYGKYVNL